MTKEDLLREFLKDELVETKYGINKQKADAWKITDPGNKLVEAIKMAVMKKSPDASEESVARDLNKFLSK